MNAAKSDCTRWEVADVCVDAGARKVTRAGHEIPLPRLSWDMLLVLLRAAPNAVTADRLMDEVWPGLVVNPETVTKRVNLLRLALDDDSHDPRYIEAVRGYGYRVVAPVTALANGAGTPTGFEAASRRWRFRALAGTLATVLAALLYYAVNLLSELPDAQARNARVELLPEATKLLYERDFTGAWRLAREAQRQSPNDPQARHILESASVPLTLRTVPAGAEVSFKDYLDVDGEWEPLDITPLVEVPVPDEYLRWRIRKDGFETLEMAWGDHLDGFEFKLLRQGTGVPEMVRIPAGEYQLGRAQPVALEPYWIDEFEVDNEQFQRFVDAGGYSGPTRWSGLVPPGDGDDGFDDAVSTFVDTTGRHGPAGWQLGRYPEGKAEMPVSSVSWFEAVAFCRFVGKRLPTLYHWQVAAGRTHADVYSEIVQLSNFSGDGVAPTGQFRGLGPFGGYDMAGNVKEWVWNAIGEKRYILGGAWNEAPHMFVDPDARLPGERQPNYGFRCAKFADPADDELLSAVERPDHDFAREPVVDDEVFAIYRSLYVYDHKDLAVKLESEDEAGDWRRETLSFDAGYGDERVLLRLFLPERAEPPYQAVLYFPGATALRIASSEVTSEQAMMDFIPRSGRALAMPVFKGMYERRVDENFGRPITRRDLVIQWARDIGRTIDYLETRPDMDISRVAFAGLSLGAEYGPIFPVIEDRFRTAVFLGGGFDPAHMPDEPAEINPWNFAPRLALPVLMINGHHDFLFPLETSQRPMFELLGTPPEHKRHVVIPGGHVPPWNEVIRETLDWLDRYLGPVPPGKAN